DDEDAFVKQTTSTLGPQPPNFQAIVALNRGALQSHRTDIEPLTPRQVDAHRQAGALLVDVRTDLQFDEAHIPGAVCNPAVRAGFGTKLAWVADRDQPVVLIGRDDTDAVHAAHLATSVGITNIVGYLAGGMTSWREEKRETASVERIDVRALHDRINDVQVLDVREQAEWQTGHIPAAVHTPYHDIHRMPDGINAAAPVAVICSSGQRSALAGSLLLRHGAERVIHVADGGVGTWAKHGWPIEEPHPAGGES
ncbi:MAG: rhodanese-like domain-containing protein, partial [Acidimicrobiales bacterium]